MRQPATSKRPCAGLLRPFLVVLTAAVLALPVALAAGPQPPDATFTEAMSAGLRALDEEDWETARAAFERALELRPEDPAAADGLARAAAGAAEADIRSGLEAARALEAEERWREAADAYAAVLQVEPTITAAREGRERTAGRADLLEAISFHLDRPERLASAAVLAEARSLAEDARETAAGGSRLAERAAELERLVAEWSQPQTVTLVSDGETDVTIRRVGELGAFDRRTVELAPGAYTVIGSRRGYRDVRRELVVTPGDEPPELTVACEEPI